MELKDIYDRLVYRRQFVLGPRPVEGLLSWNRMSIGRCNCLSVHPDLSTTQVVRGEKSLTLLGFILDPYYPDASDRDILEMLLSNLRSEDAGNEWFQGLDNLGGRWVLIADDGKRITLFHDALGQRMIYYTSPPVMDEVWCGSQPGIIGKILGLEQSQQALEFAEQQRKNGQEEYWFPNDTSAYEGVKLLLPNHCLDLATGRPRRFWPTAALSKLALNKAVKISAQLLRGLVLSAANRFPLEILITAGWDSRVVLAAASELKSEVSYFTLGLGNPGTDNPDVKVPARLLPKLGKAHHVLEIPKFMGPEFKQLYLENVSLAHECWGSTAEALLGYMRPTALRVTGSGSETVRQQFRPSGWCSVTPRTLAAFARTKEQFAIEAFAQWMEGVPKEFGFDILDLFYWEQKCGQWLAAGQVEWDIVGESFAPFNCRALLSTLLSTHRAYRVQPSYELYRTLLKELCPEVLSEPINPHKTVQEDRVSLKALAKKALVRFHLIEYVR